MKYRLIIWSFIILVFLLQGCLSQIVPLEEYIDAWKGRPLSEHKDVMLRQGSYPSRIGWQEKTYKLDNGNLVYVEPIRPDCFIHWEVNPEGIIIGYKTEGNRCY
jgi:hypothetical protein